MSCRNHVSDEDCWNDWEPGPLCQDCDKPLTAQERDHSRQGFGHYRRCCRCYDRRMRGRR